MKLGAMIITKNEREYLPFCLDSIRDIVDCVAFVDGGSTDGTKDIIHDYISTHRGIVEDEKTGDDYAGARNQALDILRSLDCTHVLWLDADEVVANEGGTPCTRQQFEELAKTTKGAHLFTRHFIYNYFTIDGRNNGNHFSLGRFFRLNTDVKFEGPMHEQINTRTLNTYTAVREPMIWHFGECKGEEFRRDKYRKAIRIAGKEQIPYGEELKGQDVDDYCSRHELFRGTRPLVHYRGPLPRVMRLW